MARERLGELLLGAGLITQGQLVEALREQARSGVRLGQILVDHGIVDETSLYDALARVAGLERFNLRTAILERSALNLVTGAYALEHGLIPFRVDVPKKTVHIAISDPTNVQAVDELSFRIGLKVKLLIASETEVQRIVRHHFYGDPLDRDPRSSLRQNAVGKTAVEVDPASFMGSMEQVRDEVVRQRTAPSHAISYPGLNPSSAPPPVAPTGAPGFGPPQSPDGMTAEERALLAQLKPIFESQEDAAKVLRAIFALCVARGVIRQDEYLQRLANTPD